MCCVSSGQVGRALGPLCFCSLYWWAGRDIAYGIGGAGMVGVTALVYGALRAPPQSLIKKGQNSGINGNAATKVKA